VKKQINTDQAPKAIGPYSQAVLAGNTLFISGQIPLDPTTGIMVSDQIEEQTVRVLENLKAIVEASHSTMANIVKTTILLADMNDFSKVNEIYSRYFNEPFPARATFEVSRLPRDAKVEIEAVAVLIN